VVCAGTAPARLSAAHFVWRLYVRTISMPAMTLACRMWVEGGVRVWRLFSVFVCCVVCMHEVHGCRVIQTHLGVCQVMAQQIGERLRLGLACSVLVGLGVL
jgi:hypothetical protein